MASIFLSHNSTDKPFVEKLAHDLRLAGADVWFDKWTMQVGDSLLWKIEEGIRDNEYLGIVLSPNSVSSEWVKVELESAWMKQLATKKVVVLPILYQDCELPWFLSSRLYADFKNDYYTGFLALANVLGIDHIKTISDENWRSFVRVINSEWQKYREREFERLVTALVDRAIEYNWSSWVGSTKVPFSITLYAPGESMSLRLDGKTQKYMASFDRTHNPNRLKASDFTVYAGETVNECEEFVWRRMKDYQTKQGNPVGRAHQTTRKILGQQRQWDFALQFAKELNWYKGDRNLDQSFEFD